MFYNGISIITFLISKHGVRGLGSTLEKNVKTENSAQNCEIFTEPVDKDLIFITGKWINMSFLKVTLRVITLGVNVSSFISVKETSW